MESQTHPPDIATTEPDDNDHEQEQESLAERFTRLCSETAPIPSSPTPGPPDEHSPYLTRNPAGELFLTPEAVTDAEGPHRPAVLSAFRAALAEAYGDDDVQGTTLASSRPINDEFPNSDAGLSFCALNGFPEYEPPDIAAFTWEGSRSKEAIDHFLAVWQAEREAQQREDAADAAAAMARAAAAGTGRSRTQPRPPRPVVKRRYSFNADPILWAAQEDAAASAVLKELRTNLGKLKKGSSKAPHESSAVWALLKEGKGKLKPEAAAEMARAKVAAAAAAAAMREVESQSRPEDSLQDLKNGGIGYSDKNHSDVLYQQLEPNRRAHSSKFDGQLHDLVLSKSPGFPRALSLDSSTRLKNVGKKKRVEFAAGTVFVKK